MGLSKVRHRKSKRTRSRKAGKKKAQARPKAGEILKPERADLTKGFGTEPPISREYDDLPSPWSPPRLRSVRSDD